MYYETTARLRQGSPLEDGYLSARVYIFVTVPKWNLAVTKLVTRKEPNSHPMRYIFGISASRRPNIPNFSKS